MQGLSGSLGVVLTVPITALIASFFAYYSKTEETPKVKIASFLAVRKK